MGGHITLRKGSQEQFLGGMLLCATSGQHSWHLRKWVSWSWRASRAMHLSNDYSSPLDCSDLLFSNIKFPLFGNRSSRILLASFQGKLIKRRLEDEPQPLHSCWSQGHIDTHHFFPLLPTIHPKLALCRSKWLILWGNPDSHPLGVWTPDSDVLRGLWLLCLILKTG